MCEKGGGGARETPIYLLTKEEEDKEEEEPPKTPFFTYYSPAFFTARGGGGVGYKKALLSVGVSVVRSSIFVWRRRWRRARRYRHERTLLHTLFFPTVVVIIIKLYTQHMSS